MHLPLEQRVVSTFVKVLLLAGAWLIASAPAPAAEGAPASQIVLRFDGVYQSEKQSINGTDYYLYLRFYDDGTVISASFTGTPEKFASLYRKDKAGEGMSRGYFVITGTRIIFTADSEAGKVDYDGNFLGEQLEFRTYSHINQYRGAAKFSFVKVGE